MKRPPEWIIKDCIRIANQDAMENIFFGKSIKDLEDEKQKIEKEIQGRKEDIESHKKAIKEAQDYLEFIGVDWKNEKK